MQLHELTFNEALFNKLSKWFVGTQTTAQKGLKLPLLFERGWDEANRSDKGIQAFSRTIINFLSFKYFKIWIIWSNRLR